MLIDAAHMSGNTRAHSFMAGLQARRDMPSVSHGCSSLALNICVCTYDGNSERTYVTIDNCFARLAASRYYARMDDDMEHG